MHCLICVFFSNRGDAGDTCPLHATPAAWIPATAIAIATSGNPVSEPPPAEGERGVPAPRAILEQVLPQAGCQVVVHGSRVRLQDYEGDQIAAPLCVVRHAPSPLEAITPEPEIPNFVGNPNFCPST